MEKKFGFGIIGTGNIAKFHADCIEKIPNARLLGVLSKSESRAGEVAGDYNGPVFWEMEKLLSQPEIDIICVCNESGLHGATIAKIAKAGKHILCEKPLETTVEKIDRIAAVVKSSGSNWVAFFKTAKIRNTKSSKLLSNREAWVRFYCAKPVSTGTVLRVITRVLGGAHRPWTVVPL